jgi:hypothetical protein
MYDVIIVKMFSLVKEFFTVINKKGCGKIAAVKLVKIIREKIGKNPWEMKKLLEKPSIQAYLYLERETKGIKLRDLVKLQEISGMSDSDFWALVRAEAIKEKPPATKKKGVK